MKSPIINFPFSISNPRQGGFAYVALIVILIIIGISLGAAGKYWSYTAARDKEEELLFRGDQYRQAIERYYAAGKKYPAHIDDLLNDERTPDSKHHLRKRYKDPITDKDFLLIRHPANKGLIGVLSRSGKEPFRKDNFDESHADFANKGSYYEWAFVVPAPAGQKPVVAQVTIPGKSSDESEGGTVISVMQPVSSSATTTAQKKPPSRPGRRRF